jgi:hypothetical protein
VTGRDSDRDLAGRIASSGIGRNCEIIRSTVDDSRFIGSYYVRTLLSGGYPRL